jgi:hypothetical protein
VLLDKGEKFRKASATAGSKISSVKKDGNILQPS